jgi:hypothetical protein
MDEGAKKLNDAAILPTHAYRRNHTHYELVCYVNCLVGCRISGNSDGAALFEERARQFMVEHQPTPDLIAYYEIASAYIDCTS